MLAEHLRNRRSPDELERLLPAGSRLHFIGIGGVSMSALAMLARSAGYSVQGSDRSASRNTEMLRAEGIPVFPGHEASQIEGANAVIYNAAIHEDNPELARAIRDGIPCIYRADFLAFLTRDYQNRIGVAGMHGKTTTSAMLSHLFLKADRDPTILIGAELSELGRDFRIGGKRDLIFEACEYQDSFLSFLPTIALVLNEEMDHPDWFHSMDQVRESFRKYLMIPGKTGFAVLNADDENVLASAESVPTPRVTFGIRNRDADFVAEDIVFEKGTASFSVLRNRLPFCRIRLSVPGLYNVSNALGACAAASLCGIPPEIISEGISGFNGSARRMEYRGTLAGCPVSVPVYDDFGHHPTEIRATLDGARRFGFRRVRCVFQPHTYSRTSELFDEFCDSFRDADEVLFVDIYAARESNLTGISSRDLADHTPNASYFPSLDGLREHLIRTSEEGDLLILMGAGDLNRFTDTLTVPACAERENG